MRHLVLFSLPLIVACGTSSPGTTPDLAVAAAADMTVGEDPEAPPNSAAALEAWIAKGFYKQWKCEPMPHAARSPSPHGSNRICSNKLLSGHGAGEYPVGAAAVKELLDMGGKIIGYAVLRHPTAGDCKTWYYYEKMGGAVVADGVGANLCVGCHTGAGSDAQHSGHDCVYTQVK